MIFDDRLAAIFRTTLVDSIQAQRGRDDTYHQPSMQCRKKKNNSSMKGGVLVEFVVAVPIIVAFFFSSMIIARKFYEIAVLTNIARSAAILGASYHGTDPVCHTVERFIVANLEGMGINPKDYKLPESQIGVVGACASTLGDMIRLEAVPGTSLQHLTVHITPCRTTSIITVADGLMKRIGMNGFSADISAGMSIDEGVDTSCV